MNPLQKKTLLRLVLWVVLAFALLLYLLVIELQAVHQGGDSTVSRLLWGLWADQPWVILLVSHVVFGPLYFLAGHFVAQSDEVYKYIRTHPDS